MSTTQINTKFTPSEVRKIDCLIQEQKATSRSDVVRYAVRRFLEDQVCGETEASKA
jgi:Arc/MetJ-type ribon-helix-helix transcriptional regulator